MKITEEEKQIRKEQIIQSAFRLFCKYGIEKVTIANVAKEAKVGESSIYRYFSSKVLLVKETLTVLWKQIGISLERAAETTENYESMTGLEQSHIWLKNCKALYLEHADYVLFSYETKLYLQRNHEQLTKEQYDGMMLVIKEPCTHALDKGKADGSIPTQEDSEDLFYAIWGSVRGYIVKVVIYDALCKDGSPWRSRYDVMERGVLSALAAGWK